MKAYGLKEILICLSLSACEPASQPTATDHFADIEALAVVREQLQEGVRTANPDLIAGIFDDDVALMSPNVPSILGLEDVRQWIEASFTEPIPDATDCAPCR